MIGIPLLIIIYSTKVKTHEQNLEMRTSSKFKKNQIEKCIWKEKKKIIPEEI